MEALGEGRVGTCETDWECECLLGTEGDDFAARWSCARAGDGEVGVPYGTVSVLLLGAVRGE